MARIAYHADEYDPTATTVAVEVTPGHVIKIDYLGPFDSGFTFDQIVNEQHFTELELKED